MKWIVNKFLVPCGLMEGSEIISFDSSLDEATNEGFYRKESLYVGDKVESEKYVLDRFPTQQVKEDWLRECGYGLVDDEELDGIHEKEEVKENEDKYNEEPKPTTIVEQPDEPARVELPGFGQM